MVTSMFAAIPPPPGQDLHLGPLTVRWYGVVIVAGIVIGTVWSARRWKDRGGEPDDIYGVALWAVPLGILGARIYHVITDNQLYRDDPINALKITTGGLGIPGGIIGGALGIFIAARRHRLSLPVLFDTVAPAIALGQAIGRWGNWFNQEIFGPPTTLPWALEVDPQFRPSEYIRSATFHPTVLYESLWSLLLCCALVWIDRRHRQRPGRLFALYLAGYTFGRFWIELLRTDHANVILGLRVNNWTSLTVFLCAVAYLVATRNKPCPDHPSPYVPDQLPDASGSVTPP